MKLIDPTFDILTDIDGRKEVEFIENVARTCYKSNDKNNSEPDFSRSVNMVKNLIKNGHEAMLEHSLLTVKFITDRGVSHEIVRHRHFSFAQESTRYCNYSRGKFGGELTFVKPYWYNSASYNDRRIFEDDCKGVESAYMYMIDCGRPPQAARAVLNNSIKTEIVVSGNYREWRHFFRLRAADMTGKAHPDMKAVACPLLFALKVKLPAIFDDIYEQMVLAGNWKDGSVAK